MNWGVFVGVLVAIVVLMLATWVALEGLFALAYVLGPWVFMLPAAAYAVVLAVYYGLKEHNGASEG